MTTPTCAACDANWPRFKLDGHKVCEWCFHNPTATRRILTRRRKEK